MGGTTCCYLELVDFQGRLSDSVKKMLHSYVRYFWSTKIEPTNKLFDIMMLNGASNEPLVGELLKIYNTNLTFMLGVKDNGSLFFNSVFKIPIVNQIVPAHTEIHNIFGHGIFNKPRSTFK